MSGAISSPRPGDGPTASPRIDLDFHGPTLRLALAYAIGAIEQIKRRGSWEVERADFVNLLKQISDDRNSTILVEHIAQRTGHAPNLVDEYLDGRGEA